MPLTALEIAKILDHALLAPTLTLQSLEAGLEFARDAQVATVCIAPFYVQRASEVLDRSGVLVSTVVGFPHGSQRGKIKLAEAERALRDGASELDVLINLNRVLSGEFKAVEREIAALTELSHAACARIKVIFENCYLQDSHKIRLCEISGACGVDWVKTSTGFGPGGATLADLELMRRHAPAEVQVKASGGVRCLDDVLKMLPFVTRCGTSRSREILEEARNRFD